MKQAISAGPGGQKAGWLVFPEEELFICCTVLDEPDNKWRSNLAQKAPRNIVATPEVPARQHCAAAGAINRRFGH